MYNAYGRIADWNRNFPNDQISNDSDNFVQEDSADAALDRRLSAICTAMKQAGIRIYVVGFEIERDRYRDLLRNCATEPNAPYFMEAPRASDLENAFRTIGNELTRLRLTD